MSSTPAPQDVVKRDLQAEENDTRGKRPTLRNEEHEKL